MYIKTLDRAEKIVGSNEKYLIWDQWDIVAIKKTPSGQFRKDGMFIDGAWYTTKRIPLTESGWYIPKRYVRDL